MSQSIPIPTPPLTPDSSSVDSCSSESRRCVSMHADLSALSSIREPPRPTDTLIFTNLTPELFLPENIESFKHAVTSICHVVAWIPLRSFARVVVAFESEVEATKVRSTFRGFCLLERPVRIFWGENSKQSGHHFKDTLAVPALERNWLISPPGSPPVGWTQVREDPPNAQSVHEDLLRAIANLSASTIASDVSSSVGRQQMPVVQESNKEITLLDRSETRGPGIVVHPDPTPAGNTAPWHKTSGIERSRVGIVNTPMPGY